MNKTDRRTLLIYCAALFVTGVPAAFTVMQIGTEAEDLQLILRLTARAALLVFLVIFVARPLHQLRLSPGTRTLLRNRRSIGVAFAGIMTIHLAFIMWLWVFVIAQPIPPLAIIGGGGAYLMILLMLITSFDRPARAMGPRNWRRLHKVGLYWIGIVFANTIVPDVISDPGDPFYITVTILALAAIAVRVAAHRKRKSSTTSESVR